MQQLDITSLVPQLQQSQWRPPFPPIEQRTQWVDIAERLGTSTAATVLWQAEEYIANGIPALPATLWLDFARTGNRTGYEDRAGRRRRMLWNLTLAECLEDRGRFLDPMLDIAWATCEESSWAYPAHEAELTDIRIPYLDLGAAGTALMLAEMNALMSSRIDPRLSKRIRDEIDRRCFTPYLERDDHWWLFQSKGRNAANWTAVCNSGIVGAAIYLEQDSERLATMIVRALRSLVDYLDSFAADGGTSEGPGYWGYGFGNYVILADLLYRRTDGFVDILAGERLRKIASFPLRTLLSDGIYANFADCDADVAIEPALLHYLGDRLDLPAFHGLARAQSAVAPHRDYFDWGLRSLFWLPPSEPSGAFAPADHDWLESLQWFFARMEPTDPNALVLAAKGGHNDEMHNQNDIGTFIVHWCGEALIADPGRGKYTKDYFGEKRYEQFVNSSLGHAVPVVNGALQGTGADFAAQVLDAHFDTNQATLRLDLTAAYPATANLVSLQRRLTLHREAPNGWISVEDHFAFSGEPTEFESALTTFHQATVGENSVIIKGIHGTICVSFVPTLVQARIEEYTVDYEAGPRIINRIAFSQMDNAAEGKIKLVITPLL